MLKDGTYAAWFKTPLGQGTGIAHVADGKIWGRDSIMTYSGSCEVDGDRFTAIVSIKRHTEGHATVFGADDLTLRLEGACAGNIATYLGTAEQVPGVLLEGILILSEQQTRAPEANEPTPKFDPAKVPKLPKRSRRLMKLGLDKEASGARRRWLLLPEDGGASVGGLFHLVPMSRAAQPAERRLIRPVSATLDQYAASGLAASVGEHPIAADPLPEVIPQESGTVPRSPVPIRGRAVLHCPNDLLCKRGTRRDRLDGSPLIFVPQPFKRTSKASSCKANAASAHLRLISSSARWSSR